MRPPEDLLDNVEIIEPPLEELTRKGSFFKQTCFTGCGCIVFFIFIFIVSIKLFLGSGPQTVKTVPTYFPPTIPLYDKDAIEKITVLPGKYEKRSIELALFFPKIILTPLANITSFSTASSSVKSQYDTYLQTFKALWQEAHTPSESYPTTITIEWQDAEADPEFMVAYYKNELKKNNFTITVNNEDKKNPTFSFTGPGFTSGSFQAQKKEGSGTSYAVLKVTLPSSEFSSTTQQTTPSPTLTQPHDQKTTSPSL